MSDVFTPQLVLDKAIDHCTAITGGGFPISLYPSKIQRIIREVNDCYGFPVDYVAAAMLVAVSVAIGNTHLALMKEGWDESAILYMALIGRPGANKSHPLSFAMRPFVEHDYEQNRIYEKQYLEYQDKLEMSRKERAEKGELVEVSEIAKAYQAAVDHLVSNGQIYFVLHRHGWRKVMPRSKHPRKASDEEIAASKKLTPQ